MKVKCKTISPLFIGCGEEYSQLDYFIENDTAHIIDLEKAISELNDLKKVDEISRLIISNTTNNRLNLNAKDILESIGLNAEDYVVKKIKCEIKSDSKTRVKRFIHQNNNYYVPGSSIKGAIRTAYIFNYFDRNFTELIKILKDVKISDKGKEVVNRAISKNIHDDFFKYLLISDSDFVDGDFRFITTKRWKFANRRLGVKVDAEVMMDKNEFEVDIKINDEFFEKMKIKLNKPNNDIEKFEKLKDLCNEFSKTVVEFELKRNNPVHVEKFYEKLLADIRKGDVLYLNLGFGGGFLSKTVYPLLWKHDKENRMFKEIKRVFLYLAGRNTKLKNAWYRANSYLDFPTTKTFYVKDKSVIAPLGWIKMELGE